MLGNSWGITSQSGEEAFGMVVRNSSPCFRSTQRFNVREGAHNLTNYPPPALSEAETVDSTLVSSAYAIPEYKRKYKE